MSQVIGLPKGKSFVWHTLDTDLRAAIMGFGLRTEKIPAEVYVPQPMVISRDTGDWARGLGVQVIRLDVCGYICVGPMPESAPKKQDLSGISGTVPSLMARFKGGQ